VQECHVPGQVHWYPGRPLSIRTIQLYNYWSFGQCFKGPTCFDLDPFTGRFLGNWGYFLPLVRYRSSFFFSRLYAISVDHNPRDILH
jgi:hypothetical protein